MHGCYVSTTIAVFLFVTTSCVHCVLVALLCPVYTNV